jgi:hypothetical protein
MTFPVVRPLCSCISPNQQELNKKSTDNIFVIFITIYGFVISARS